MKYGSWNAWLSTFEVGERRYEETTLERYAHDMRVMAAPVSRRPEELTGREFVANLFTALAAGKAGDIRYLICIERIQ